MKTIDQERLAFIKKEGLLAGKHDQDYGGFCILEAVAFVTHQPHRDFNVSNSPIIERFLLCWNDSIRLNNERTTILTPFIEKLALLPPSSPELEKRRYWKIVDWGIRSYMTSWLRSISIAETPEIKDHQSADKILDLFDSCVNYSFDSIDEIGDALFSFFIDDNSQNLTKIISIARTASVNGEEAQLTHKKIQASAITMVDSLLELR